MHAEMEQLKNLTYAFRLLNSVLLLIKPQFLLENLYRIADALSQKIDARGAKNVTLDYDFRVKISQICSELDVDGLRGDIVTNRAAKALAAFEVDQKLLQDIFQVIPLCFTVTQRPIRDN
jgi:magnesium chelatase subunit I